METHFRNFVGIGLGSSISAANVNDVGLQIPVFLTKEDRPLLYWYRDDADFKPLESNRSVRKRDRSVRFAVDKLLKVSVKDGCDHAADDAAASSHLFYANENVSIGLSPRI